MNKLNKMVDTFLERGFTYFDTAVQYHNFKSEIALRKHWLNVIQEIPYTVATKIPTMFLKKGRRLWIEFSMNS